jgi:thiamine biosynthesis protein ThiI
LDAVYFDTPPYTSPQARDKVEHLTRLLTQFVTEMRLYVVPFTETQLKIKERAKSEELTLMMRACMVQIAEQVARRCGALCLITGESLGQVASQTLESIRFTGNMTSLPIFRPLIGLDKDEIIVLARKINTYETSILPYEDCCTLFSPSRPLVRPNLQRMMRSFQYLDVAQQIRESAKKAQPHQLGRR